MTTSQTLEQVLAEYRAKFDATLAAVPSMRTRQLHDTGDGILAVNTVDYGHADLDAVIAGTAPAIGATLTEDGGCYNSRGWHDGPAVHEDWVRVERWTTAGREFHGFIHRQTRQLLQAG